MSTLASSMSASTPTFRRSARGRFSMRNPAVELLVSQVARRVEEGTLREGDRLPSLRDLAKEHKLTFAIARAAVEQLERVGLVERLHGSGTYIRPRREAAIGTSNAAYLYLESRAHLVGDLAHDLTGLLHRSGVAPFIVSWQSGGEVQTRTLFQTWEKQPPRAVVMQGLVPERDQLLRSLPARGTRVITLGYVPQLVDPSWHSVTPDFFNAHRMAAKHALTLGHRRIGLVLKQRVVQTQWAHTRRKALMVHSQQILGAGQAIREMDLHNALTIHYNRPLGRDPSGIPVDEENVSRMTEWLKGPNRPTAVIGDDYRMLGVRLAAIRAGLKVPDDLLMIGIGGTFLTDTADMPTVSLRFDVIAEQIARIITIDERDLNGTAQHVVVPPVLLDRSKRA